MSRPAQRPDEFPAGNGKVGDTVLVVTWRTKHAEILDQETWRSNYMTLRPAKIIGVGFLNQHDYPLNIEVQFAGNNHKRILSAVSNSMLLGKHGPSKTEPAVLILCPREEQPTDLQLWALANKAIVVRNPACEPPQLGLRCARCLGEIIKRTSYVEAQEIRWWQDGFSLGKPEIVDGDGESLECDTCDAKFHMPEDVEDYE